MYFVNDETFSEFYLEFWPRAMTVARSYASNDQEAEDCCSEAFEELWKRRAKIQSKNHAEAFSIRKVKHAAYHASVEKKKVAGKYSRHLQEQAILGIKNEYHEPFVMAEYPDLIRVFTEFLENLNPVQRAQFKLYFNGIRSGRIASILGRNETTVANQIAKTRRNLFELIQGDYPAAMRSYEQTKWHLRRRKSYNMQQLRQRRSTEKIEVPPG